MTKHTRPEIVVFYAWQSDRAGSRTRYLIQEAAAAAASSINADPSSPYNVRIDQDTQGVPGLCDIPATILEKINGADVFLCDLTYVALSMAENDTEDEFSPRHCSNPNVLFELGYAFRAMGFQRIVCVMNEHYGPAAAQIFDLAHRRHPFAYRLPVDGKSKATVRADVAHFIETAIRQVFPLGRRAEQVDTDHLPQLRSQFESRVRDGKFHGMIRRKGALAIAVIPARGKTFSFQDIRKLHLAPPGRSGWNNENRGKSALSVALSRQDRSSIAEIRDDGMIFVADTWILDPQFHPQSDLVVPSISIEAAIINSVFSYLEALGSMQAPLPWSICISLLEIKDYWFLVSNSGTSPRPCPETDVAPEPLIVRNAADVDTRQKVAVFLKPAIDFIWREFGLDGSYNYTETGLYNVRGF